MQVTPKESTVIPYLPQEIRETTYTDIIYRPVTREVIEQLFSNSPKTELLILSQPLNCNIPKLNFILFETLDS